MHKYGCKLHIDTDWASDVGCNRENAIRNCSAVERTVRTYDASN